MIAAAPAPARVARVMIAAALVALGLGVGAARPAAGAAPLLRLVEQPGWVVPGEPFEVRVQVSEAPPGAQLAMVVHDRLESRRAFRASLAGELGGSEHEVAALPIAGLPLAADGSVAIGFTPGDPGAGLSGRGVYPVELRLLAADGSQLARLTTYLTYLEAQTDPPEFPPLKLAVVLDVGAPPALQPDGTVVMPPGTVERAGERAEILERTPGVPLTLAPRPETLEALATAGGPEGAAAVERMREAAGDLRVIARPFVDIDLAAFDDAGLRREANFQAEGGADVVRERLDVEPVGGIWLSGPTLGDQAAGVATELGFERAVVPATAATPAAAGDAGDEPTVPLGPVRLGADGPLTVVSDPSLTSHLLSQDGVIAAHRFIAELAITWLEEPSVVRGATVRIPPDARLDPDVVATALGSLAGNQGVEVVPVEHVLRDVPLAEGGTVAPAPHEVEDRLGLVAGPLTEVRRDVSGVGSVLDDATRGASLDHSLLMSTGTDTPNAARRAYVAPVQSAIDSLTSVVSLPEEFRITLTTRSSKIPIRLTNLSDQTLSVRVELDSDQLEFPDGDEFDQVLPPGTTQVDVPVRTRTSGAFTLRVTVTSPNGALVLDTSTFDVRSTAISGVGIVLSIGAVLFLAIWWARHWHRSRRSPAPATPTGPDVPDAPGATRPVPAASPAAAGAERGRAPPPAPPTAARGSGDEDDAAYRPAHMARQRSRSG